MLQIPMAFVSEFLRRECADAWPERKGLTAVIYNGADGSLFSSGTRANTTEVPNIIFTGRLIPIKGVHVLVKAMGLLQKRGVPARCTIVGAAGFGKNRMTRYVRKLHTMKAANTTFTGYLSGTAVAGLLKEADIYCLPSIWNDPFPLSILEALATGLPVVASRTGGIPEELAWGGGIAVAPDNAEHLADALQSLLQDASLRERIGREAQQSFREHFRWSKVWEDYSAFVQAVSKHYG